ncbi:hypothetical protein E2C01_089512 [Portunus trituberculatus]|uniref:Uncharacterized protein n=1 Tax=Portunus trituberculatus TaxID=210409 RepID=A0A5B7JML3_PORTR|nr:hypothetical protein [Portunus trituberculatus]
MLCLHCTQEYIDFLHCTNMIPSHSLHTQAPDVTVYVRRPDYEAELVPKVTLGRPRPRLVPAFTWTPPPAHPSWAYGRIQQLSSYEQYLLYGAHLTVATVEVSVSLAGEIIGRKRC